MSVKALILCAGRGTRLQELTEKCPKPLLPVGGKALVMYTLELLADHGIRDVAINLHYQAERFPAALGDGARFGMNIHYEIEDTMLGTAGAVANLGRYFQDAEDVLVIYGDLLLNIDLTDLHSHHKRYQADATLLIHQRSSPPQSIVELDDATSRIVRFRERPKDWSAGVPVWVNSGCQFLSRALIQQLPDRRPLDLPRDVYSPMASELLLYGVPLTGYRIAIDSPDRYRQANDDVAAGRWKAAGAESV